MEEQRKRILDETELFVLDMDGTFYLGERLLPGAMDFIRKAEKSGKRYLFFTNNSSKSPKLYMEKLARMGCRIGRDQIMTSGDVTIEYLKARRPGKSVYLLGTPALRESFAAAGIPLAEEDEDPKKAPDIVVVGFDTTLTYERLERACRFIRNGAEFLATHLDINCPTEDGFIPDCGSICAAISLSTGKKPKFLGKPFPETVDMVLRASGGRRERTAFVGDRIYTDVATGVKNGARGLLVLTGETKREDVENSDIKPDGIYESLGEMAEIME